MIQVYSQPGSLMLLLPGYGKQAEIDAVCGEEPGGGNVSAEESPLCKTKWVSIRLSVLAMLGSIFKGKQCFASC